jgi:hypothetical protein
LDATIQLEPVSLPEVLVAAQKHRKDQADTAKRFRDLLAQLTTAKAQLVERAQEAERLRTALTAKERELAPFQSEREKLQKEMPALIAKAVETGRKLFPDFDEVVGLVNLAPRVFGALLTSPNGVELMYALGLGLRIIDARRQKQADDERINYYRIQHQAHFSSKGAL